MPGADPFRKVQSGEPFRGLPARPWNAMLDLLARRQPVGGAAGRDSGLRWARLTGSSGPKYSWVEVECTEVSGDGPVWADKDPGDSGTFDVEAAYELNGLAGLQDLLRTPMLLVKVWGGDDGKPFWVFEAPPVGNTDGMVPILNLDDQRLEAGWPALHA